MADDLFGVSSGCPPTPR